VGSVWRGGRLVVGPEVRFEARSEVQQLSMHPVPVFSSSFQKNAK
jgi:hypothetical protein